jgi:hypothetical protein
MLNDFLAQRGILVRLLDASCLCSSCSKQYTGINAIEKGLRFGLPKNESDWQRLEKALNQLITLPNLD